MEKSNTQDLQKYLEEKGKRSVGNIYKKGNRSVIKTRYFNLVNFVKKWGYRLTKYFIMFMFIFKIEQQFSIMRNHVAKNGGFKQELYQSHRPY